MSIYDEYVLQLRCNEAISMFEVMGEMDEQLGKSSFTKCNPQIEYIKENMFVLFLKNDNTSLLDDLSYQIQLFYKNAKRSLDKLPSTFKSTDVNLLKSKIDKFNPTSLVEIIEHDFRKCEKCGVDFVFVDSLQSCNVCGCISMVSYEQPVSMEQQEDFKTKKSSNMKHFSTIISTIYGEPPENPKSIIPDDVLEELKSEFKKRNIDVRESVNYSHAMKGFMNDVGYIIVNGKRVALKEYTSQCNYILTMIYPDLIIPRLNEINEITLKDVFLKLSSVRHETNSKSCYLPKYTFTISRIIYMLMYSDPTCMRLLRFIDIGGINTFSDYDEYLKKMNDQYKLFPNFITTSENIYSDLDLYEPYYDI